MLRHWRTTHHNRPGKPPAAKNLRPISIASIFYRMWAVARSKEMADRLQAHLPQEQHGCIRQHHTLTPILQKLGESIGPDNRGIQLHRFIGCADFSKAFGRTHGATVAAGFTKFHIPQRIWGTLQKQLVATRNGGFAHHSIHRDLLILAKFCHKLTQRHPSAGSSRWPKPQHVSNKHFPKPYSPSIWMTDPASHKAPLVALALRRPGNKKPGAIAQVTHCP